MARAILSEFQDTSHDYSASGGIIGWGPEGAHHVYSCTPEYTTGAYMKEDSDRRGKATPPLQSTHIVSREWAQCEHAANPYSHPFMLESRIHARVPRGSEASPSACREAAVRLSTALRCS